MTVIASSTQYAKMTGLQVIWLVITMLHLSTAQDAQGKPSIQTVEVRKCCKLNESASKDDGVCTLAVESSWKDRFYHVKNNNWYPGLPVNWQLVPEEKPQCEDYEIFLQRSVSSFVALETGEMYVSEINNLLTPQRYCVDEGLVMTCNTSPSGYSKVNQCCAGMLYSFNKRSCAKVDEELKIEIPNGTYFVINFPICEDIVLVGKLEADGEVLNNGSLKMTSGSVLPKDDYCLTYVENDSEYLLDCLCPNFFLCNRFFL